MLRTLQGVIAYGRALALKARALAEGFLNGGQAISEEELREPPPKPPPKQRVRHVYPTKEVVLAALKIEPQGVAAIAKAIGFEQEPTSKVIRGLVMAGRVLHDGKGRWTTYRLPDPKDAPDYGEDGAAWS